MSRSILLLLASIIGAYLSCAQDLNIPTPPIDGGAIFSNGEWITLREIEHNNGKPQPPKLPKSYLRDATIFVSLQHYRDARCATTVDHLLKRAKYPDRVHIGIIQQIHTEQDKFHCLDDYCSQFGQQNCPHRAQLHLIEFSHQNSRGPSHARFFQSFLLKDEEFCFQIDSHSSVVQDWDTQLLSMWEKTENEYAILSALPPDVSTMGSNDISSPHLCQARVDESGLVVNLPPTLTANLKTPILAPLYSAAFSFSKCHLFHNVQDDPNLQMFFDGDEFSRFIRLWTSGYDAYTPTKPIVFHDYHHSLPLVRSLTVEVDSMEWQRNGIAEYRRALYDKSIERMNNLYLSRLGSLEDNIIQLGKFGLGTRRSLKQFLDFTGVNVQNKMVFEDRCHEIVWVPYKQSPVDLWGKQPEQQFDSVPLWSSRELELFDRRGYVTAFSNVGIREVAEDANLMLGEELASSISTNIPMLNEKILIDVKRHRGKELWWIFQWIDSGVERAINEIDRDIGIGRGRKVMKVVLMVIPVFVCILILAVWLIQSGKRSKFHLADLKKV